MNTYVITVKLGTPGQDLDELDQGWLTTYEVEAFSTQHARNLIEMQLEDDEDVHDYRLVHVAAR